MASSQNKKRYQAFISYRHADNKQQGRQWATWLHQAIETYQIPSELVGTKNEIGEIIPERIFPIFRDEDELPAHADLGNSITKALDQSKLLIVLCSPQAVQSTYVADEISYFKSLGHSDRIIASLIEGEPNASWDQSKQALGFRESDECFPVPLQFEYDQYGKATNKRAEPIAADFRVNIQGSIEQGWTSPAAYRLHLTKSKELDKKAIQQLVSKYQQQQHLMLLKIIAGVLSVPLGKLTQRDKEYQLAKERKKSRRLKQWSTALSIVAILAITAGIFAFFQMSEAKLQKSIAQKNEVKANQERDIALMNQSIFLLDQARVENQRGEHNTALLLALNAYPGLYGGDRPKPSNSFALTQAVMKNRALTLYPHEASISAVTLNPDSSLILSSTTNNRLSLWSANSKTLIRSLPKKSHYNKLQFSSDGKYAFLLGEYSLEKIRISNLETLFNIDSFGLGIDFKVIEQKGEIIINSEYMGMGNNDALATNTVFGRYSALNGELIDSIEFSGQAKSFTIDKQGNQLLFIDDKKRIVKAHFNSQEVNRIETFEFKDIDVSPNGESLVAITRDNLITFWSTQSLKNIAEYQLNFEARKIEYSPTGSFIALTDNQQSVQVWNALSNQIQIFGYTDNDYISELKFSDDDQFIAFSSGLSFPRDKGVVTVLKTDDSDYMVEVHHKKDIENILFSKRNQLITASKDGRMIEWDLKENINAKVIEKLDAINSVVYSKSGRFFALGSSDKSVSLHLSSTLEQLAKWTVDDKVNRIIISDDERMLISESGNRSVDIFNTDSLELLHRFKFEHYTDYIEISPDSKLLAVSQGKQVYLYDMISHQLIAELAHDTGLFEFKFTPDSQKLIVHSGADIVVWSVAKHEKLFTLNFDYNIRSSAVSGDGLTIATPSQKDSVIIWSLETGKALQEFTHSESINSVALSSNNQYLLSTTSEHTYLWSLSGERIQKWNHRSASYMAKFTPDNSAVLIENTEDNSNEFRYELWNISSSEKHSHFTHQSAIFDSSFSPDGKYLLTGASDNLAIIWPLYSNNLIESAIKQLTTNKRCLTKLERKKYFLSPLAQKQLEERHCSL